MATLNLDSFGEIMDKFLQDAPVQMLLTMPEGTIEVAATDNIGLGATVQFYILLQAFSSVAKQMAVDMGIDRTGKEWRKCVRTLLRMLEDELDEPQKEATL
ncbi:MAG: hypothetical protein LUD83_09105 [Clostridiales bacterium]|nr:hypothetical protein [Clostridiales bacterium]